MRFSSFTKSNSKYFWSLIWKLSSELIYSHKKPSVFHVWFHSVTFILVPSGIIDIIEFYGPLSSPDRPPGTCDFFREVNPPQSNSKDEIFRGLIWRAHCCLPEAGLIRVQKIFVHQMVTFSKRSSKNVTVNCNYWKIHQGDCFEETCIWLTTLLDSAILWEIPESQR